MKYFISILFTVIICRLACAQYYYDRSKNPDKPVVSKTDGPSYDHYFFLNWDLNNPINNNGFITDKSSLGIKVGLRKQLNSVDRLWVGGDFSWSVYKQYFPYATYPSGSNGSISTDYFNYSYNYSLTVNIDYLFLPTEKVIVPYGGLGLGLAYYKFAQYYNIYGGASDSWGLMIRPEAGILIGFGNNSSWRAKVGLHYDYATNKNSDFDISGFSNYGFQIGLVKMAW